MPKDYLRSNLQTYGPQYVAYIFQWFSARKELLLLGAFNQRARDMWIKRIVTLSKS
jgi:hypothetical protein